MDIQAIIKQVISLAGMVIKNPSTSVKGSGIDFGSLINIAGSMMGNKSGSSSQGGGMDLGSLINMAGAVMGGAKSNSSNDNGGNILGSVLGGLMGGGSSNSGPETSRSNSNNDDSGLGSILGGLAGMAGMGNAMGNMFSREEASSLMSDVNDKENTISDMLKNKNLNQEEKGNLTNMLGLLQVAGTFLKK